MHISLAKERKFLMAMVASAAVRMMAGMSTSGRPFVPMPQWRCRRCSWM